MSEGAAWAVMRRGRPSRRSDGEVVNRLGLTIGTATSPK
jgi:hypothetical protein